MNFPTYLQTVTLRAKPMPPAKQLVHAQIGMISELAGSKELELTGYEVRFSVGVIVMLLYAFLVKYDFTVEQCLIANDAKLEKRTGKAYNREAILNRDTDAERKILEDHGQARSDQAAG